MRLESAGNFIVNMLRKKLPQHLSYHNVYHTLDVRQAAEQIGTLENISNNDMELLLTAAYYHDSGYLTTAEGHEEQSCVIAQQYLPGFGYSHDEITIICEMIMATRLPQSPKNHLQQIIADADLDYLGRDDFFSISDELYNELVALNAVSGLDEWNRAQVKFIKNHSYFTASAINLRDTTKQQNLRQIEAAIKPDIE